MINLFTNFVYVHFLLLLLLLLMIWQSPGLGVLKDTYAIKEHFEAP